MNGSPPILRLRLVLGLLACVACGKDGAKKSAPTPTPSALLANPQGLAAAGKGALVAQQCGIACGAKPGIDSGACTQTCIATCANEPDVATIDTCASRTADHSPEL